jgi:uncharacterized alpha-E superfamily protein
VLSRIAESLFWIGRYVERADDTARILDAFVHRALSDPWADEDHQCRSLLAILGVVPPAGRHLDTAAVMDQLAYDETASSAIAGAIAAARRNAQGARETVSSDVWECLNVTWRALPERRSLAARLGPSAYLDYVRDRAAMLAGLAESTLSRDDGWHFLVLGRSLERADMTARLLSVHLRATDTAATWTTVLSACGAHESFLHTHGGAIERSMTMRFLVLDRIFPRSILHSLSTAEQCLAELAREPAGALVADRARRLVGHARTTLEYADAEVLLDDLGGQLLAVQQSCAEASHAVSERFFSYAAPMAWSHEEA